MNILKMILGTKNARELKKLKPIVAEINRIEAGSDTKMGIITSSTSYQYVKEVCGDKYPVLKLGMIWPLPEQKILDFAKSVDSLVIVEELDSFIENHCRQLGLDCVGKEKFSCIGEFSQNLVAEKLGIHTVTGTKLDAAIPPRPPVMCAGCPHRGLFYTLAKNKLTCNPCVAHSDELLCNGCSQCANVCPYGAITYIEKEFVMPDRSKKIRRVASVNPAVCQGCGACTVTCPSGAMDLHGFSNRQIMAEVDAICK